MPRKDTDDASNFIRLAYTFAVRDGEQLVSFTKAYSGLTDKEINEVDNWGEAEFIGEVRACEDGQTGTGL